jgi:hypothetical protein
VNTTAGGACISRSPLQYLYSGQFRHADVQKHDIRPQAIDRFDAGRTVGGFADLLEPQAHELRALLAHSFRHRQLRRQYILQHGLIFLEEGAPGGLPCIQKLLAYLLSQRGRVRGSLCLR